MIPREIAAGARRSRPTAARPTAPGLVLGQLHDIPTAPLATTEASSHKPSDSSRPTFDRSALSETVHHAGDNGYIRCVDRGCFHASLRKRCAAAYAARRLAVDGSEHFSWL